MANYDICTFQELFGFGSKRQHNFIQTAKQLGFKYVHKSPNPWKGNGLKLLKQWKIIDGGLVILSKFPIVEQSNILFTHASSFDAYSGKGALYALIQVWPYVCSIVN